MSRNRFSTRRSFLGGASIAGLATITSAFVGGQAAKAVDGADAADTASLAGDATTDDAPALQRLIDAGKPPVFVKGRTYLINSPVFLDTKDRTSMLVLELNGATLLLGKSLPTTDAFYRDPTTKWAFFPNTSRSALSGGKVNVAVATRATGVYNGALISLVVRNGTVDGNGANVGFAFSNRTGAKFESVMLTRGRTLLSWNDYSDASVFIQCHNRAGGPAGSVLVEQINSGDGLLMQTCKADASVGIARLKYCRGGEIVGTVTGRIELDQCSAISIRGGHQETPIANETIIDIKSSEVVIDTTVLYLTRGAVGSALPPAVRITDTGSVPSFVVFRDCTEMRALQSADEELGAMVSIDKTVAGTKVEMRGVVSVMSAINVGGVWPPSVGPDVTGAGTIAAATTAAAAVVAGGNFILRNPGPGWSVVSNVASQTGAGGAPAFDGPASSNAFAGTLSSKARRYRAVGVMADGTVTPWSAYTDTAAAATGCLKFAVNTNGGPQELRVFRYVGTSTTPEAHVFVPAGQTSHVMFDTGAAINGFGWVPGG